MILPNAELPTAKTMSVISRNSGMSDAAKSVNGGVIVRTLKPVNPTPQDEFWDTPEDDVAVYVTNLEKNGATPEQIALLYAQRADTENVFDELKNQWGFDGFCTGKGVVTETAARQARIVIEPFERGFGHTLGNALRRVLLSSMPGCAVTEVEIEGVLHEYTSIEGVQEDVVDILLNLKGIVFKLHNRDEVTLTLRKEGEGTVTAGDIDLFDAYVADEAFVTSTSFCICPIRSINGHAMAEGAIPGVIPRTAVVPAQDSGVGRVGAVARGDGGGVNGASAIPLSQWTHVVHTYKNGEAKAYVNGVLDGTTTGV